MLFIDQDAGSCAIDERDDYKHVKVVVKDEQ